MAGIYEIEPYESAILAMLAGIVAPSGPVKTLAAYNGELAYSDGERLREITKTFPAVYVLWSGTTYRFDNRAPNYDMDFVLLAAAASLRGCDATTENDLRTATDGVYAVLDACRQALAYESFDVVVDGETRGNMIQPLDEGPAVDAMRELSLIIYQQRYRVIGNSII